MFFKHNFNAIGVLLAVVPSLFAQDNFGVGGFLSGRETARYTFSLTESRKQSPSSVLGLAIVQSEISEVETLCNVFTNMEFVSVLWTNQESPKNLWFILTKIPKLRLLQVIANKLETIDDSIDVLSKCPNLECLTVIATNVADISPKLYSVVGLQELSLRVKVCRLEDGISGLNRLQEFTFSGNKLRYLAGDFDKLSIKKLTFISVPDVEHMLPRLPIDLNSLVLIKCDLEAVPLGWRIHSHIKEVTISGCGVREMPSDFTGMPMLESLVLFRNTITHVPKLKFAAAIKTISLDSNPIEWIHVNNLPLINRGIIVGIDR